MSLFSENIIEEPWINMVYQFWHCTNPNFQGDVWVDAFKINWSATEMKKIVSKANVGTTRFSKDHWDEVKDVLDAHGISFIPKEYYYLILIILLANGLNGDLISQTLTNCLSRKKLAEGGSVEVKIKQPSGNITRWPSGNILYSESEFVFLIIHVKTTTPQRIEITLKKR